MEVLIAAALGSVVMVIVAKAYQGLAKAQGVTQGAADLRRLGEASTEAIYRDLKQARRLFARSAGANVISRTWYGRTPIENLTEGGPSPQEVTPGPMTGSPNEFVLPVIFGDGLFSGGGGATGPSGFELVPSECGNALMFLTQEPKLEVVPSGATPGANATEQKDFLDEVFGPAPDRKVYLSAYRLHVYFVARKPLGSGPEVRPGSPFTYTVMHWKSKVYADVDDCDALIANVLNVYPAAGKPAKPPKGSKKPPKLPRGMAEATGARAYVNGLFAVLGAAPLEVAGAIQPMADDAGKVPGTGMTQAVFDLMALIDPKGGGPPPTYVLRMQENSSDEFVTGDFRTALKGMARSSHAAIDLAFNTEAAGSLPAVPAGSLRIPLWGDATTGVPFGFETAIVGSATARQVMYRISLTGRTLGSRGNYAQAFQQVVAVSEN